MATKKKKTTKKKATKKKATKRKASARKKTSAKKKTKRKPNKAFMAPLKPSASLAKIVGSKPLPRTQVVKRIWQYIKKHKLQDAKNKRMINPNTDLKAVLGKGQVSMFQMAKLLNKHLSK